MFMCLCNDYSVNELGEVSTWVRDEYQKDLPARKVAELDTNIFTMYELSDEGELGHLFTKSFATMLW